LISSTAIFMPTYSGANDDANMPVIGRAAPTRITSPRCAQCEALAPDSVPAASALPRRNTSRRVAARLETYSRMPCLLGVGWGKSVSI
jgi:hypothetical protein